MYIRNVRKRGLAGLALAITLITPPAVSFAKSKHRTAPSRSDLEERVRILERKLEERDRGDRRGGKEAEAAALDQQAVSNIVDDKLKSQKLLAGWQDGFFLQSASGDFKLKLRGYAQADARFFPTEGGDTGTDQFYLRRLRPIFEGTVYKYFNFRTMLDFANGTALLQDGYLNMNYWQYAQLTAGKMKSPVSLERLQSGSELTFIERSIANNLAPNREVGVTFGGNVLDGALTYSAGVFNGQFDGGNNDNDVTSDKDFEGRVWGEPFKNTDIAPLKGLGFGVGGSYGTAKREDIKGLSYSTAGRSKFFRFNPPTGTAIATFGERTRIAPGAYWYWGPFGLMGEYIDSQSDLLQTVTPKKGPDMLTPGKLDAKGWFVEASWVLTGENNSYKQVNPINAFDPANGRWGAVQVAARASGVDISEGQLFNKGLAKNTGESTSGARAFTGGVNWYLNKNFKLQLNWEHTEFDDRIKFGKNLRTNEDVFISRFQISY